MRDDDDDDGDNNNNNNDSLRSWRFFGVFFCPVFLSLVQLLRGCISYFVNHK